MSSVKDEHNINGDVLACLTWELFCMNNKTVIQESFLC